MFHVEFVLRDPSVGWSSVFRSSVLRLVIEVLVIRFSVIRRCFVGPFFCWSSGSSIPRGIVGVSVIHVSRGDSDWAGGSSPCVRMGRCCVFFVFLGCFPWGATVCSDSFSIVFPLGAYRLCGTGRLAIRNAAVGRSRTADFQGRFGSSGGSSFWVGRV